VPAERVVRLRSKKRHQRIDTICLRYSSAAKPRRSFTRVARD